MRALPPVEIIAPPSPERFLRTYVAARRPVIIRGAIDDWPARTLWTPEYLKQRFGDRDIEVARMERYRVVFSERSGVAKARLRFSDFIDRAAAGDEAGYMISGAREQLPELLDDVRVPSFCPRAPWFHSRFWLGPMGTVSPLHRDLPDNLFAQLEGKKRVVLIDRRDAGRMYAYPWYSQVPNYSRLDAEEPDYRRFPRAREARAVSCVVEPGDLLFIPSLWWHQVRSLDFSISINLWWAERLSHVVIKAAIALAKLRGLRW